MKLVFFTSVIILCIIPCAYSLHADQVQPSTELAAKREVQASQLHALPRKLGFAEKDATMVGQESKGLSSAPDQKDQQQQNGLSAGSRTSGTWQERREGNDGDGDDDTSALFTMDYARVRRRRPIHNKSLKPKGVAVSASTP